MSLKFKFDEFCDDAKLKKLVNLRNGFNRDDNDMSETKYCGTLEKFMIFTFIYILRGGNERIQIWEVVPIYTYCLMGLFQVIWDMCYECWS